MVYDPWFGAEFLMIDYNLNVGDTLRVTPFAPDIFVVQAISDTMIGSQNHSIFHIDTSTLNHRDYYIIEGIGFIGNHLLRGIK